MYSTKSLYLIHYWLAHKTKTQKFLFKALLVVVGTALLTLSAKIQVPFWPVPISMNNVTALTLGYIYGPFLGASTLLLYLLEGLMGLPVFSGGAGWSYFWGPTLGYLVGYVLSAFIMGLASKQRNHHFIHIFGAYTFSWILIYGCALLGLMRFMSFEKAFMMGVVPYLFTDMVIKSSLFSLLMYMFNTKQRGKLRTLLNF